MNRSIALATILALAASGLFAAVAHAAPAVIRPTEPASLSVTVEPGSATLPDGKAVSYAAATLTFDAPTVTHESAAATVPNYAYDKWFDPWQPWPGKGKDGKPTVIEIRPKSDAEGALMLGGLFRMTDPATIVVTSEDGSRTFKQGVDYMVNPDWAQIATIGTGLGALGSGKVKVSFDRAVQRLDLVQVSADGKVSVKKGKDALTCPALPAPDAGAAPLAGVYIAAWKADANPNYPDGQAPKAKDDYAITAHEILPINPAPAVEPINPQGIAAAVKALKDGKELKIAFMGDSITLGAEAPAWWNNLWTDKNLGYPSRVVMFLRGKYPKATVTPIAAFKGGTTTEYGLQEMDKIVVPEKPGLVVIAFGANDASGGAKPRNPADHFKEDVRKLVKRARETGAEVLLVVPMQTMPFGKGSFAGRLPDYRKVLIELGKEENVGVADVYTAWLNQASEGVPPFSQLHNWLNHPGKAGHAIYAETIDRFFE